MAIPGDHDRVVPLPIPEPDPENPLPIVLAKDGTVVLSYMSYVTRGLKADGAFEIKDSAWVRDSFCGKGKHYVFTLRDAVFECAAEGYGAETIDEDADVVRLMSRRLYK